MSGSQTESLQPRDRPAEWLLLVVEAPGEPLKPVGIILLDVSENKLLVALAEETVQDEDVREVLAYLKEDIQERASEVGAKAVFDSFEELSLSIRIDGPRHRLLTSDPTKTLANLFREHVLGRQQRAQSV